MTDVDSILNRIRSGLAKHGRKSRIAEHTGLSHSALTLASRPDWNPNADTIRALDAAIVELGYASPDGATKQLQDGPALPAPPRAVPNGGNDAEN